MSSAMVETYLSGTLEQVVALPLTKIYYETLLAAFDAEQ